jgi:hypothetical protein
MRQAKAFFFVCLGLLCIVVAYHVGAQSASAQAPGNPVVCTDPTGVVYTSNGDAYQFGGPSNPIWLRLGNVFSGGPVSAQGISIGQLKAKYATPAASVKP